MSIHHQTAKIKTFLGSPKGHSFMVVLIILGVSVSAFCLGFMSKNQNPESPSGVVIETNPSLIVASASDYEAGTAKNNAQVANSLSAKPTTSQNPINNQNSVSNKNSDTSPVQVISSDSKNNYSNFPYVASSRGKKYYPVGCSAVKTLSQTNLIYFKDQAEAEAKGYSLSTSCK